MGEYVLSDNRNLQKAKNDKNDEFYTQVKDVEEEISHYDLKDKIIYCPCDTIKSAFFSALDKRDVKALICTGLGLGVVKVKDDYLPIQPVDCFSEEARAAYSLADIVITNPPFSLFREFLSLLLKLKKDFLILGPLNAVKYKDIFPYIKKEKVKLGYCSGSMSFRVPDSWTKDNVKDGIAKFGNICWYTNLSKADIPMTLTESYDPERYPVYDNYQGIDVNSVRKIPKDYTGVMGVPITVLQKFDYDLFEIVGELNHGCDNEYDFAKPTISGKELFPRILIRRRQNVL